MRCREKQYSSVADLVGPAFTVPSGSVSRPPQIRVIFAGSNMGRRSLVPPNLQVTAQAVPKLKCSPLVPSRGCVVGPPPGRASHSRSSAVLTSKRRSPAIDLRRSHGTTPRLAQLGPYHGACLGERAKIEFWTATRGFVATRSCCVSRISPSFINP